MRIGSLSNFVISFMVFVVSPAMAGDVAQLNILGFSEDGGIFAFEEYGVGDGSGFPYANRFYINTETDEFLPHTPIRVTLEDEAQTVETARAKARQLGEAIVKQAIFAANPGFTAGSNAVTEYSADPNRILVNPRPIFFPVDPPLEFRLENIAMNGTESCASQGEINGFRLLRVDASDGGVTRVLHEDKSIPKSRGCPSDYSIGAVQTFEWNHALTSYAVVIAVRRYGFEGPDFRWIAVAGRF